VELPFSLAPITDVPAHPDRPPERLVVREQCDVILGRDGGTVGRDEIHLEGASTLRRGEERPDELFALLDRHKVRYGKATRDRTYTGYNYRTGSTGRVDVSSDDYIVSAYQPKSVLARIFFEPRPELTDSLTYDITAWGQHYAFGLDGYALKDRLNPVEADAPDPQVDNSVSGTPYAYLAEWSTKADLKLLARLLNKGVKVRFASQPFRVNGRTWQPGTLVITRNGNADLGGRFDAVATDGLGQDLGVRAPAQAVPSRLELATDGAEVVDLTVEHHRVATTGRRHRLKPALRRIDDGQPAVTEPHAPGRITPGATSVRPSMGQRRSHLPGQALESVGSGGPGGIEDPRDPAHGSLLRTGPGRRQTLACATAPGHDIDGRRRHRRKA
jgi:hypothetical protein